MAKKQTTKKTEKLNAEVKYEGEGELITDKPSEPLKKKTTRKTTNRKKTTTKKAPVKKVEPKVEKVEPKTNKELFNEMIMENESFIIKYKGEIIFDSDKDDLNKLSFQNNNFSINGIVNTYDGLSIKFK